MDESTAVGHENPLPQADSMPALGHFTNADQSLVFPQQYKKYIDFVVLIVGCLVVVLGFTSVLAHLLGWPQPVLLSQGILYCVSYPISWALTFLGMAVLLILPNRLYALPKGQGSKGLTAARSLCLIIPVVIGLYYVVQHLTSSYKEIGEIVLSPNPQLPVAFFSALYTALTSLVLFGFWHFHQRQWYSTY